MNSTARKAEDWEAEKISASQSNSPVKPGTALGCLRQPRAFDFPRTGGPVSHLLLLDFKRPPQAVKGAQGGYPFSRAFPGVL